MIDGSLRSPGQGEFFGRSIAADDRASANSGTRPHPHRGHQGRIGSDEGAIANLGQVFIDAVIIAGDGPRADVDVTANAGIADVGEMADLGARTDRGLFDFNEVADVGPVRDVRLGSQAGEGSDLGTLPRPRVLDDRVGQDSAIGADGAIFEEAVGAYADAIAQLYLTLEEAVDIDGDITPGPEPTPHIDAVADRGGSPLPS